MVNLSKERMQKRKGEGERKKRPVLFPKQKIQQF